MRPTRFLRTVLPLALVLGTVLAALSAPAPVLAADQTNMYWSGTNNGFGALSMDLRNLGGAESWIKTFQATSTNASAAFLFRDSNANFANKWARGAAVSFGTNTIWYWQGTDGTYNQTNNKYYTFIWKDVADNANSSGFVFETDNAPVTISSVTQSPGASANCVFNEAVTVNVTLSSAKSSQEKVYIRYTTNDWANTTVVEITNFGSGSTGSATIPAQTAGTTVKYYVLTTATTVNNDDSDANLKTINLNNNGGANYSYTVANSSSFKYTTAAGNWDDTSKWDGSTLPGSTADVIVRHNLTLNQDATIRSIKVCPGATFNGGSARTLTLEGSSSASPTFTNAGSFTANTGTVHFQGQSASGNTRNGRVWGPTATTFNNVTITYNGGGSGASDTFGVDFYDQDATAVRATINGVLTLNTRTFVANQEPGRNNVTSCTDRDCGTPTYGSGSTLKYNDLEYAETEPGSCSGVPVTNPFQTYSEWLNATSGHGVPNNVTIGSDSWVSLRCNAGTNYRVNGDFTIDAGVDGNSYGGSGTTPAGFEQNGFNLGTIGTSTLTMAAGKDVINNGTLKQSGTPVASGTTSFVTIKDNAGTPATLYYGVDIVNGSALGVTTVKVSGNQETCPYVNSGSRPVKRCYYFNVENAASPQVIFYYEYTELRSGQDPATLNVWKDNGNGTWTKITPSARSACTSGISCSVTVTSLTEGMGPLMTAGANRYVIMGSDPQAVTLAEFYAAQQGDAVLVTWETASELNNRGFNLYRGTSPAGPDRQLNATLIPSQSQGSPGGFVYTWTDQADLTPGVTYFYWVEDVDLSGAATMHGPVSVDFTGPTAVTLSGISASPAAGSALPVAGALLALLAPLAGALAVRRWRV